VWVSRRSPRCSKPARMSWCSRFPGASANLRQRLGGAESLAVALRSVNRDTVIVSQAIAALGPAATVPGMIRLLGASEQLVRTAVGELCRLLRHRRRNLDHRDAAHSISRQAAFRPTGFVSRPLGLDDVPARLRETGLSPIAEDAQGAVIVEARHDHPPSTGTQPCVRHAAVVSAVRHRAGPSVDGQSPRRNSDSWCHLPNAQRDFTIANIEAASPAN
jgi:hypothetical protein